MKFLYKRISFLLLLSTFFWFNFAKAALKTTASGKLLHINSLKQKVVNENKITFSGDVEALIDQKLHLLADSVEVDREKQFIVARANDKGPIKLETNDFIILADYVFLDLEKKTGKAENVRIHVDEGYFAAKSAQRVDESTWELKDLIYTACDEPNPHWHFHADSAVIHGSYFVRVKNPVFRIGKVPILYLPGIVCPIQGHSKSGFLMPKLYFDYYWGFGLNLAYYKYFNSHMDTTVSMDWKDRLGVVFSDEFRWGRSLDSYTQSLIQYAIANNAYVLRGDRIVQETDTRYWIYGKDFGNLGCVSGKSLKSLIRADFGTNKRIDSHFFNNTEEVDDTFLNSGILRMQSADNMLEFRGDNENTSRKSFYDVSQEEKFAIDRIVRESNLKTESFGNNLIEKKEIQDKLNITKIPHFEWGMNNKIFKNILFYRHDLFFDQVWYRQSETERLYLNSQLVKQIRIMPLKKDDLFRFGYRGQLQTNFAFQQNNFKLYAEPQIQYRSDVLKDVVYKKNVLSGNFLGNGKYKIFSKVGAEWAMPELVEHNNDFSCAYFVQPIAKWNFMPKFYQDDWYYIDFWDRAYPTNELAFGFKNSGTWYDLQIDFDAEQGIDFYNRSDIFCLRRGVSAKHLLPFSYNFGVGYDIFKIWVDQEIEWHNCKLLQSQIGLGVVKDKLGISASYLFQNPKLQKSRELLTNISNFILINFSIPINKQFTLFYDAQFYDESAKHFGDFVKIKPLIHRLKLDYAGHCWGFYIGFEQKKYREYGNKKDENTIVFALRIDSLGSFANKIRRPLVLHKD